MGAAQVLQLTGNPVLTGFTAPKILWVRENEPDVYGRISHILLPKDYARYKLTGEFLSDVSDASGTALFDVGQRVWSDEMLRALDVPRAWLPEVTESPIASAKISADAARATGLIEGTPVVAGGGDQAAGAVGTGSVRSGIVSATLGTSGVMFAPSDEYRIEPQGRLHAFCHAVPGKWHLMGVMLSAAGSFRWYRDALGTHEKGIAAKTNEDVYDVLQDTIEMTKNFRKPTLTLALSYGGREEIIDAVKKIVAGGNIHPENISQTNFSQFLYTADMPEPDLLIRTSGELRVSNFLLWQIAYSEIWVTDVLWPDFRRRHLLQAIADFQKRERRYGGIAPA